MFSRTSVEADLCSNVRSSAGAQDIAIDIAALLEQGVPVVALIGDLPRALRSGMLQRIEAELARNRVRVIHIEDAGGPVDLRGLCWRLAAASGPEASPRDAAGQLAQIFTAPREGERGLALILENADALSADALGLLANLAAASGTQTLHVQALLLGSPALEARLSEAGSFVVKRLGDISAAQKEPPAPPARAKRGPLRFAAVGCVASVMLFGAVRSGDREKRAGDADAVAEVVRARAVPQTAAAREATLPTGPDGSSPAEPTQHKVSVQSAAQTRPGTRPDQPDPPPPQALASSPAEPAPVRAPAPDTPAPSLIAMTDESPPEPASKGVSEPAAPGPASPPSQPFASSPAQPEPAAPAAPESVAVAPQSGSSPPTPPDAAPALPKTSPVAIAALLARGHALLETGDVATARLVYQRAVALNSGQAATATGRTYDPRVLAGIGALGVVPDPEAAASWYRKGAALGDQDAPRLLGGLQARADR